MGIGNAKVWLRELVISVVLVVCGLGPVAVIAGEAEEVTSGYDNGFYFQRGDQKLKVYGYIQTLWTAEFGDESLDSNEFMVKRGRLLLSGNMVKDLGFKMHVDFAASRPLLDYFVDYVPTKAFGLRAGQFKTPLGRQFLCSAAEKQFVDDTISTSEFKADRDIGLMAHGEFSTDKVEYQAGVFNGSGKNARQDNTDLLYVARLALNPLGRMKITESDLTGGMDPLLSIAVSTAYNTLLQEAGSGNDVSTVEAKRWILSGELAFQWAGLSATSEVFWRLSDQLRVPGAIDEADLAAMGGHVQAGYFVIPSSLELGARAALVRPDSAVHNNDLTEFGFLAGWFFGGHQLKLQADYTVLVDEEPGADAVTDHRVRLQLQAAF